MIKIFSKETDFYDLFDELGSRVVACASHLQTLTTGFPDSYPELERIHAQEQAADEIAKRIHDGLNKSFVPPFDREDVHALTGGLDDIIDHVDEVSKRFAIYHIESIEDGFPKQTELLVRSAITVNNAVRGLRTSRQQSGRSPTVVELHRLKNIGDDSNQAALRRLFDGTHAALFVLKWKELHALVEAALDACEDVGNILERIVLKA